MFAQLLKPGDVVFDVGANVGYYSILASRCVGEAGSVIALEPSMRNLFYLYRHLRLNRITNVLVITAACSDSESLQSFTDGENCALGHLTSETTKQLRSIEDLSLVPTTTIDAVALKLAVRPDLLKIDVEGAELEVLRGAEHTLRTARPNMLLEIHSDALYESCCDYLAHHRYQIEPVEAGVPIPAEFVARPLA